MPDVLAEALASLNCGPSFISGVDTICDSSLLLVLVLASKVFSGFQFQKVGWVSYLKVQSICQNIQLVDHANFLPSRVKV